MFFWKKKGKIFSADGQYTWMNSHTTPVSAVLLDKSIRVFICTRTAVDNNGNYISNTSFIDVKKEDPSKILYIHNRPVIDLGDYGAFDEFGIMVTNVLKVGNEIYLYYAGWQRLGGGTAAYQVMLGLAISRDDGITFTKVSKGPIMGIDYYDPITIGNVAVIKDSDDWRLYYTSITEWVLQGEKPTYEYVIKYATSKDGIFWKKEGKVIINIEDNFGVATPTVIKINNRYHMWFGYRKAYSEKYSIGGYRIGYAFSNDGENWTRNDHLSKLDVSKTGWDSEMICYPDIIHVNNKYYLFYCGNGFGKDGFGFAELVDIL